MNDAAPSSKDLRTENASLRAEVARLRETEAIYRLTLQSMSDAVFVTDTAGAFTYICPNAHVIFGYSPEEIAALGSIQTILGADLFDPTQLDAKGELTNLECEVADKEGQLHYLLVNVKRVTIGAGSQLYTCREVTERKQVEAALRASEERYRLVTELVSDYAYLAQVFENGEVATIWATDAYYRITGYPRDERKWQMGEANPFIHPEDVEMFQQSMDATIQGQETVIVYRHLNPERGTIWIEVHRRPIWNDEHKRVVQILGSGKDVTAHKRAEDELRRLRDLHTSIVQSLAEGLSVTDEQRILLYINPAGAAMFGYQPDELIGQHLHTIIHPDYRAYIEETSARRNLGESSRYEVVALRKDGSTLNLLVSASPRYQGERITGSISTFLDITDRKQGEEREREQRVFAEALASAGAAINSTLNLDSVLTQLLDRILQVVPHDGANIMLLDAKKRTARVAKMCACYAQNGLPIPQVGERFFAEWPGLDTLLSLTEPILLADVREASQWVPLPDTAWIRAYLGVPIRIEGELIGILNVDSRTVGAFTPRHAEYLLAFADQVAVAIRNARLYEELQNHTEQRYRIISDLMCDYACAYRLDSLNADSAQLEWVIGAFEQITGRPRDEALASFSLTSPVHPDDRDAFIARQRKILAGQSDVSEYRFLNPDGSVRWIRSHAQPEWDDELERVKRVYIGVQDITELKETEMALRAALDQERALRTTKSQMISMLTHDFRNPLASIQLAAEMLNTFAENIDAQRRNQKLNDIITQTRRMNDLMEDMLTIGTLENKPDARLTIEHLDIYRFCRHTFEEFAESHGRSHNMRFTIDRTDELQMWFDPKLMWKILTNLLSNATKYSPAGSQVQLSLARDSDTLTISIADEGIGIPAADQDHLFDTFYRARNTGDISGTGLGLAIVQQAVELHGGKIAVESATNLGTTFHVTLPITTGQPA